MDEDECDIDVVEQTDSDNGYDSGMRKSLHDPIDASNVEDMVNKVLAHIAKDDCCIGTLTIVGHACPGNISVGNGQHGADRTKEINGRNEDVWGPQLDRLKGKFCEGGLIILRGCSIGADQRGADKLFAIAQHTGANVEGFTGVMHSPGGDPDVGEWVVASPTSKPDPKAPPPPAANPPPHKQGGQRVALLPYRDHEAFRTIRLDDIHTITVLAKAWRRPDRAVAGVKLNQRLTDSVRHALQHYAPIGGLQAGLVVEAYVDLHVGGSTQQEIGVVPPSFLCGGCRYLVVAGDWSHLRPLGEVLAAELRRIVERPSR